MRCPGRTLADHRAFTLRAFCQACERSFRLEGRVRIDYTARAQHSSSSFRGIPKAAMVDPRRRTDDERRREGARRRASTLREELFETLWARFQQAQRRDPVLQDFAQRRRVFSLTRLSAEINVVKFPKE